MMKSKILMAVIGAAVVCNAATIKDVKLNCTSSGCGLTFQFVSADDLPSFYQKYNAASKMLTLGFSDTKFAMGEGIYEMDASSQYVRSMRVFKDTYRGMHFLKVEMTAGPAITGDKNDISLNNADFTLKINGSKEKGWTLSRLYESRRKAAEKATAEEKKRLAEEKKAAAKQALIEKRAAEKAAAEEKKAAEKAAAEEKKRLAAEQKAAARQALVEQKLAEKQAAKEKKAAELAAAEEKKRIAEEKKIAEKQALLEKKAAEKAAAEEKRRLIEEEKRLVEEQKKLDKAIQEGGAVSALLPGLKEMTVLVGAGMEQFRLITDAAYNIGRVSVPDKNGLMTISINGPQKSPVFKIGSSSLVKSVGWGPNGLQIQLQPGAKPAVFVHEGALIMQTPQSNLKKDGFAFWTARSNGIYTRNWVKPADEKPSFDSFVGKYENGSKKIVSAAQVFHLRPVVRELIVVSDETEFYAAPNENSQVVKRLVFGDRLVSIDVVGLYCKVQFDNRTGYVNRRAVSYFDELSSVQTERLKQVDKERGNALPEGTAASGSMLESLYEDRIIYSSFGRRDPFVEIKGMVEEGINIDQVELVGIIWESEVPMAILVESKNPSVSYTLKEGDKILNGKVLKITQTDVLFLIQEFGVSRRYSMGLPDKFGGQK